MPLSNDPPLSVVVAELLVVVGLRDDLAGTLRRAGCRRFSDSDIIMVTLYYESARASVAVSSSILYPSVDIARAVAASALTTSK